MFLDYLKAFNSVVTTSSCTDSNGQTIELDDAFQQILSLLRDIRKTGKRVYLVGNGGSSGIVSHGGIDFLNACGFKAHAITDNSLLTCIANDYGYENVFSQPLSILFDEGDVLVAISSSGNSQNIINACEMATSKSCHVITFSGFKDSNKLRSKGDFNLWLSDEHYGRVEIGHSLLLHYIIDNLAVKK